MQIKHMDATEMAEVAALQRENFAHPWSEKDYMEHLQDKDKIYLTAVKDGRVVGSCVLWCSFETADLCNIVVDPAHRREGIAEALLHQAFRECAAKGVEQILLEVRESNASAIGLYDKSGFDRISVRKNYYRDPQEHAVIMQKTL